MEGNGTEKDLEEEDPKDVLKSLIPDKNIRSKLFPHQREGIVFFFNAYKNGKSRAKESLNGVILADEMGLGKSIQVILFLHGMIMNTQEFKHALLIVPAGLLDDWMDKLKKWTPKMNVLIYHHRNTELQRQLMHLQKTSGVLLVSYSTFIYRYNSLRTYKGKHFSWDCMICDEAHKLKNPATKTHKAVALIPTAFNILITGTPMQNNLREFWSLFSLISDTYLLGTYKTFKKKFETPITKGMEADSGPEERALGMELQKTLKKITEPFYLRRTKAQMQDQRAPPALKNIPSEQVLKFPKKNEYVVWIKMTPEQEAAYRKITDDTPTLSLQSSHSLIAVCTYPRSYSDVNKHEVSKVHLGASGKLTFMLALLESFATNGNFALVFSNYIKVLDIIQNSLTQTAWGKKAFLRIDGQNINERDNIIKRFQKRGSKTILLLTTTVGSEGLTLTAADCVVFADLSWNQSQDAQAVGRAHRIGQTKDVQTYRLITCGTLEERIYRRQLFKGSLTRQVVGDEKNPLRHFTQDQLKGIFTLQETRISSTQQQLEKQGAKYLNITEVFGAGFNSVAVASVCGISDHGQLLRASQGEDLEVDMARMHITETVKMSQQQIEAESHLTRQQIRTGGPVKKPVRKDKIRRRSHEPRTPGLPRKYKCYTPPFSGTRRKTVHLSKPCIVESSDSSNFSTDDEVNLSENAVPHISVSVKSKVTGDSVNQRSVSSFMCNKDNDGIPVLSQESTCYGTESISRPTSCSLPKSSYIHKSCSEGSIHLKSETVRNNDEDANSFSCEMSDLPGKSMCQASPCTDKTKQTAHVSRSSLFDPSYSPSTTADERISEDIAHITESDWVNHNDHDQVKVLCNVSVQSSDQGFRSDSIMQESELGEPSAFHEEIIPDGVVSSEVGQQQTHVVDDKILTSRDTLDFSDHISKSHSNADLDMNVPPATDVNEDMSSVTTLDLDKSSVDVVNEPLSTSTSQEDIGIPDKPSDSEYCNSDSYNNRTSLSNTRGAHSYYTCPKGNYMEEHETSHLQETSSDLTNSAIVSMSICLSDLSLEQPSESDKLIDFKQEASSHELKFIDPVEEKHLVNGVHEEIVHPKKPQILNTHPCDDLSHSFIPVHPSELQETATLNQEGQEVQLTSEDIEVNMARMNIRETVKLPWLEAEAESHLTSQPFCTDVSVKKPVRKDRIRRRSHEPRTPGLPRKYKCYTSPLSGTRRKTVHLSKPCIVESSDTFNLSTDDEVNLSENAVPHNAVSLKTEITDDLVNQHSISSFMCSTMCNEDNDGIMDISQESTCYDTESISRPSSCSLPNSSYLHKSCSEGSILLKPETVRNNDEDANSFSCEMSDLPGKSMCQASPCTDKTKQTAHVSRSSLFDPSYSPSTTADERISEDIAHITESDWVNQKDQVKVLCNVSVQSSDQGFRSGSVMQESELDEPSAFHEEIIPDGVVSSEVGQQQTHVVDDKILTSRDTLDFSDHISRCHSNGDLDTNVPPATDVNEDKSSVTNLDLDKSSVDVVNEPLSTSTSQEDIGIPDKPSDSEYCNSDSYNNRTSLSNTRGAHSYYTCPKGNYMEEHETSHLEETSSDLTNSAIVSMSICLSDLSLAQPSESDKLIDFKQEASSHEVIFIDPVEQKHLNGKHSLIPMPASGSQDTSLNQEDQKLQQAEDSFKTNLKSNPIVPILCDYSLTPGCFSFSIPPSDGKRKNGTKLSQLNESSDLKDPKEEGNFQDVRCSDPGGQKHREKCEHEQMDFKVDMAQNDSQHKFLDLNLAQSESSHPSTEREALLNLKEDKLADISSEDGFGSGSKSNQIAVVLCDYSLTPGCVSLLGTPFVENGKHVLSEHFQSTPIQSIDVVHQESQDLLKRRLSFSSLHRLNNNNSITSVKSSSEGTPSDTGQLKREKRKTPCQPQKYFSPSVVKSGRRKITDLDEKAEQRITVNRNDSSVARNAEESSPSLASSTNSLTGNKHFLSAISTRHEYKYGKENNARMLPATCRYSFNPGVTLQSPKPQPRKITQTCLQKELITCEETHVKSIQKYPINTEIDTNESGLHKKLINLLANNASVRKALRNMIMPKRQLRKKRRDSSLKRNHPSFAGTNRKHKRKVLESIENIDMNQVIEQLQERPFKFENGDTSDLKDSPVTNEHICALAAAKSASLSPSASGPKVSKENSPTQTIQNSTQCAENETYCTNTPGVKDISEGGSVDSTKPVNVDVSSEGHSAHDCLEKAEKGHKIFKEDLSTSFTEYSQITQTASLDTRQTLQACSTPINNESASHCDKGDKDRDCETEDCKNEIFRLMDNLKRL